METFFWGGGGSPCTLKKCKEGMLQSIPLLKVPKCEIFCRLDFHDFYTVKPFWVADFGAKILTCYLNF
jgi:hypothetical protein